MLYIPIGYNKSYEYAINILIGNKSVLNMYVFSLKTKQCK